MHFYQKTLLLVILFSSFSFAEELFVNKDGLHLGHITLSDKYCKSMRSSFELCTSKELSYIDYDDANLPEFLKGIRVHIEPQVIEYKKNDLKTNTRSILKDMDGELSGDWDNESSIDLFAKTPTTYTLSTISSGYEGGAHGYYNEHYDNYDIKTNAKLTLDDLFLPDTNQTLLDIAQSHYKKHFGLAPGQPLTDDEWFEDNFVLAQNFAITSRGLYFFYNQYEIKSYASGPTEFMLPYSKIQHLIDPKGALSFVFEDGRPFHTYFKENDQMNIEVDATVQPDGKVNITAKMKNLSYINRGWFSLSFPQLNNKSPKDTVLNEGFLKVDTYPKGSKVYHQEFKKAINSSYLLVEGEANNWDYNKVNTITLTLTPPANDKELILDIRGNLKSKDKTIMLPNEYDGVKGQQGFTNYRVFIDL